MRNLSARELMLLYRRISDKLMFLGCNDSNSGNSSMKFDSSSILITCGCVLVLFIVIDFIKKWKIFKNIPGPAAWPVPLFGHLLRFRHSKDEFYGRLVDNLTEQITSKGHEIACVWVGPIPTIFVLGPNAAEVILRSTKHMDKGFMYKFIQGWLGTGLLTSTGKKWTTRRKLLTPTFHFSILQEFLDVMNDQSLVFTKKLGQYAERNEAFNIFEPMTLCALDIICETAMGKKINAQDNSKSSYVTALYSISEIIWQRVRSPWLWWDPLFSITPIGRRYYKCLQTLHGFTRSVIRDRMEELNGSSPSQKKRLAFLDLLLKSSEGGKVLEFSDIQEEVDTFMFEGHDTTAAAMSWATFLIGSHPDVQTRIQQELDDVLGTDPDRKIYMDDLKRLEYLELVTKECLRCFPSVPIIGRRTATDCVMDGHCIPAGTECMILPQMINNFEKFWPEPDHFDPQRFTSDNSVGRHAYSYIPFSAGSRNCIGQRFAAMEERVLLAHLLRTYTVESCDKREDLTLLGDMILRPGSGINVKLKKRLR